MNALQSLGFVAIENDTRLKFTYFNNKTNNVGMSNKLVQLAIKASKSIAQNEQKSKNIDNYAGIEYDGPWKCAWPGCGHINKDADVCESCVHAINPYYFAE